VSTRTVTRSWGATQCGGTAAPPALKPGAVPVVVDDEVLHGNSLDTAPRRGPGHRRRPGVGDDGPRDAGGASAPCALLPM